jgi:actin-like ATPase involved in cell morphogenesis
MAVGCDVGTAFLCSARQDADNKTQIKAIRDAYFKTENEGGSGIKKMLEMSSVSYIEEGDDLYIIGDSSLVLANLFKREVSRPMNRGVLAPGDKNAEKILLLLLENILGRAKVKNEICYFSVPAAPIDGNIDIVYHEAIFKKLISSLDYQAESLNEASAIAFSNAAKEQFSAITISTGAGMVNVCLMYKTFVSLSYSIQGSGDWVDENAAKAVGKTAVQIQAVKERGVDLMNPADGDPKFLRDREAISIYYKALILRILDSLKSQFIEKQSSIELPESIPIIIAGGTSKAKNFLEFFISIFNSVKDKFPIPISEIRMATGDPLHSVAQGLLVVALNKEAK